MCFCSLLPDVTDPQRRKDKMYNTHFGELQKTLCFAGDVYFSVGFLFDVFCLFLCYVFFFFFCVIVLGCQPLAYVAFMMI